jgi:hypothetical protein
MFLVRSQLSESFLFDIYLKGFAFGEVLAELSMLKFLGIAVKGIEHSMRVGFESTTEVGTFYGVVTVAIVPKDGIATVGALVKQRLIFMFSKVHS